MNAIVAVIAGLAVGCGIASPSTLYQAHFSQKRFALDQAKTIVNIRQRPRQTTRRPRLKNVAANRNTQDLAALKKTLSALAFPPAFPIVTPSDEQLRPAAADFPAFERAVQPVSRVPNWGAMRSPQVWNREYDEMTDADFVPVPAYDLETLTIPLSSLLNPIRPQNIPILTAKLYYSTRYFGAYNLDAGEFSGAHPGVDLKLAEGTPVAAIGGGRVTAIRETSGGLGLHIIIEHRLRDGATLYSVYAHLEETTVREGDDVRAGQLIGTVGMTGNTTAPHLHVQVDRGEPGEAHSPASFQGIPNQDDAAAKTVNPMTLIEQYADGE